LSRPCANVDRWRLKAFADFYRASLEKAASEQQVAKAPQAFEIAGSNSGNDDAACHAIASTERRGHGKVVEKRRYTRLSELGFRDYNVIDCLQLLRNLGKFDSVTSGAQLPCARLTLLYAENARGKTTLAAMFRSLCSGAADLMHERHRLAAAHLPHVVISNTDGAPACVFQNGAWSRTLPNIAVFDDTFVAENVCSGIEVEVGHRQRLHELILGAQGVAFNDAVQTHVEAGEVHNRVVRLKWKSIALWNLFPILPLLSPKLSVAWRRPAHPSLFNGSPNLSPTRSRDSTFRPLKLFCSATCPI
jgi:hypothetical protein